MASYHCSIKDPLSRAEGKSLAAKAAYNARTQYRDARTGELSKDWAYKGGHVESFVAVDPKANAPEWVKTDRQRLIDAAVTAEKRKDSREGQEIVLAFIDELTPQQNRWMLNDFLREQLTRRDIGRVVLVDIHEPSATGDQRNRHAHAMLLPRAMGADGTFSAKRLPDLDPQDYHRIREKWAEKGANELGKEAERVRKGGDDGRAAHLEQEAARYRHGHLDLERQRQAALERGDLAFAETLENRPKPRHKGPIVAAMELKGQETERGNAYRDAAASMTKTADLKIELAEVQKAIADYERDWNDRLQKAAIEKEKIERRFVDPQEPQAQNQAAAPELKGTAAKIHAAYRQSDGPQAFASALLDKGIRLAVVTKDEAESSRQQAEAAKAEGHVNATGFMEHETVAVNRRGQVYRLSERITGSTFGDVQAYLRNGLDRAKLPGIARARELNGLQPPRSEEQRAVSPYDYGKAAKARDERFFEIQKGSREAARVLKGHSNMFDRGGSSEYSRSSILDRTERRTQENERAVNRPRNTRDR